MKKKVLIIVLVIMLIVVGSVGFFYVRGRLKKQSEQANETIESFISEIKSEDVKYEEGTLYNDSSMHLTAKEDVSYSKVNEFAAKNDAQITGYINISNDYQLKFNNGKSYEELKKLKSEWENNSLFDSVDIDYVYEMQVDSVNYKDDPWLSTENTTDQNGNNHVSWGSVPGDNNWGVEAIGMPEIWKSNDYTFAPVNVGIIDSMFDTDHEDLRGQFSTCLWQEGMNVARDYGEDSHGTHVAGIIGAKLGNNEGIAGVAQNAKLYGVSMFGNNESTNYESDMRFEYALSELFVRNVRIINISMGAADERLVCIADSDTKSDLKEKTIEDLKKINNNLEIFLEKCLKKGYDFLIVKSAGNTTGKKYEKCESTLENPYGYKYSETGKAIDVDSKYDILNGIENENIKNHIIVVGSDGYKKEWFHDVYTESYFSNKNPEIYAPGEFILSTIPDDKVKFKHGTSMAAPMVTGVAALVWGINPNLTASEVKSILLSSKLDDNGNMINAKIAVDKAVNSVGTSGSGGAIKMSGIQGFVTTGDKETILKDVEVQIYAGDGTTLIRNATINEDGGFVELLEPGKYILHAKCDGYEDKDYGFTAIEGQIMTIYKFYMLPIFNNDVYMTFMKENGYKEYAGKYYKEGTYKYALVDVNKDGIDELVIRATDGYMGADWYLALVFTYDMSSKQIVKAGELNYVGDLSYSDKYKALEWRKTIVPGFSTLDGLKLGGFAVGMNIENGAGANDYMYSDSNGTRTITVEEKNEYFSDLQVVKFLDMPENQATTESTTSIETVKESMRLENCKIIDSDEYDKNEGDSFVYAIGKHLHSRGKVDISGKSHENGIEAWVARWNYKDESSWAYATFDIENKYKTLSGNMVLIKSYNTSNFDTSLFFCNAETGELLSEYRLTSTSIPFDFSVDVTGVRYLKVYVDDNKAVSGGTSFGLIDTILK